MSSGGGDGWGGKGGGRGGSRRGGGGEEEGGDGGADGVPLSSLSSAVSCWRLGWRWCWQVPAAAEAVGVGAWGVGA